MAMELTPNINKKKLEFLDVFTRIVLEKKLMPEGDVKYFCKSILIALVDLQIKFAGILPYDVYFPTLQQKVQGRTCQFCQKYHSSKKSLKRHLR